MTRRLACMALLMALADVARAEAHLNILDPPAGALSIGRGKAARQAFPVSESAPLVLDLRGPGILLLDVRAHERHGGTRARLRLERNARFVSDNQLVLRRVDGPRAVGAAAQLFVAVPEGIQTYVVKVASEARVFVAANVVRRAGPNRAEPEQEMDERTGEPDPQAAVADLLRAAGTTPATPPPSQPAEPAAPARASSELDATRRLLAALPPIDLPSIGDDVLVWGHTYSFALGSGPAATRAALRRPQPPVGYGGRFADTADTYGPSGNTPAPTLPLPGNFGVSCTGDADCDSRCRAVATAQGPYDAVAYDACARDFYLARVEAPPVTGQPGGEGIELSYINGRVLGRTAFFAEASVSRFAERQDSAYRLDLDGLTELVPVSGGGRTSLSLGAELVRAAASYRRYLTADALPWHCFGQVDANEAVVVYERLNKLSYRAYRLPLHATVGCGRGRLHAIETRVRLRKVEKMLQSAGVIAGPLPWAVARDIIRTWYALRDDLGYHRILLYTLRVLLDAGLLVGQVDQAAVYRFGRIFTQSELGGRRQGQDTFLSLRLGQGIDNLARRPTTLVAEVRHQRVWNLGHDAELTWAPALGVAPRVQDEADNVLPGDSTGLASLRAGRALLSVPVLYRLFRYDSLHNLDGIISLRGRARASYVRAGSGVAVGAGGDYTLLQGRSSAVSFGADLDLGYAARQLQYVVTAHVRLDVGAQEFYYVAPVDLAEESPVPLPLLPL